MSKYYNLRSRKEPVSDEFLQHVTQLQKLIDYFDQETDTMSTDEKTQLKEECFVGDTMDAPIPEEDQPKQLEPIQGVVVAEEGSKVNWKSGLCTTGILLFQIVANLSLFMYIMLVLAQWYTLDGINNVYNVVRRWSNRGEDTTPDWCPGSV